MTTCPREFEPRWQLEPKATHTSIGTGEVQSWGPINWAAFLTSKRVQPTPPQCRPGLLVLEPLWVWPLLSLQVPFYPYRTCFTIQTYQGLVQLRMTTIRPRKQLDWICISASRQALHISFPCQLWIQKAKKPKKQLMFDLHTSQPQAHQFHNPLRSKCWKMFCFMRSMRTMPFK